MINRGLVGYMYQYILNIIRFSQRKLLLLIRTLYCFMTGDFLLKHMIYKNMFASSVYTLNRMEEFQRN